MHMKGLGIRLILTALVCPLVSAHASVVTIQLGAATNFPRMLVGQNTNKRVNTKHDYTDPDSVVEYIKMASNTLRYPGGTVSQFFDWETELTYFDGQQNNADLQLIDFLALCDQVDGVTNDGERAVPLMCFNLYSYESEFVTVASEAGRSNIIEKAFRWFEYINGPTNETMMVNGALKNKLGAAIKYWEFGNELTWASRYPDYSHDSNSNGIYEGAVVYNDMSKELAALIKTRQAEIDPTLDLYFIACIASQKTLYEEYSNYETRPVATTVTSPYQKWNPVLIGEDWFDGVSEHSYVRAIGETPANEVAWAFSANLGYHKYIGQQQVEYLGARYPVWHTEWHDLALPNNQSQLQNCHGNAIANVDYAMHMADNVEFNPGLYVHQMWEVYAGMVEYLDNGNGAIYRHATGYAAEGYQTLINYASKRIPETLVGAGSFAGLLQYSDLQIPDLNVKAFEHTNGNIAIGMVNKTAAAKSVQFEAGSPALGTGTKWVLAAPALTSTNIDGANEVVPVWTNVTVIAGQPISLPAYSYTLLTIGAGTYASGFPTGDPGSITNQPPVVPPPPPLPALGTGEEVVLAWDNFESGDFVGGAGWTGHWVLSGENGDSQILTSSAPFEGTYHVQMRKKDALSRSVNLAAATDASFSFAFKTRNISPGEGGFLKVRADGGAWQTNWSHYASDDVYYTTNISLNAFIGSEDVELFFQMDANGLGDYLYFDDLELTAMWPSNDSDEDGLPDSWETNKLSTLEYDDLDDPDNDGLNNRWEWILGYDPDDSASVMKVEMVSVDGTNAVVRINQVSVYGYYAMQQCNNLSSNVWNEVARFNVVAGQLDYDVTLPDAGTNSFYRVEFQLP